MNRLNLVLTLVIGLLFGLLMVFAGQPLTPEGELVQRWYNALCDPTIDQTPLFDWTWRGDLSDEQLQTAVDAYREANNLLGGCTAVVNHNIIYFQWVPPELSQTYERIKFVAVNVYPIDGAQTPNHVLSIRAGVHVLFDYRGRGFIYPRFLPVSPLSIVEPHTAVKLYNNDGLAMGTAEVIGLPMLSQQNGVEHVGIPIRLSTSRAWGHYWVRLYANGVEVTPDRYADVLRPDQQASFFAAMGENIPEKTDIAGILWFTASEASDIRIAVDAYQTLWDMRAIPVMMRVE